MDVCGNIISEKETFCSLTSELADKEPMIFNIEELVHFTPPLVLMKLSNF